MWGHYSVHHINLLWTVCTHTLLGLFHTNNQFSNSLDTSCVSYNSISPDNIYDSIKSLRLRAESYETATISVVSCKFQGVSGPSD